MSLGDMYTRIYFEDDQARLVDRLRRTGKGFGVAAIISGALAAVSATLLIASTSPSDRDFDINPLAPYMPLFVVGWIHNGLAAPIFAHIAVTNAVIAGQIAQIGTSYSEAAPEASRRAHSKPKLLSVSPFGFALAF